MRLLGRCWQESLTGAYEEPPAMPGGPFRVIAHPTRCRETQGHIAIMAVFATVFAEVEESGPEKYRHFANLDSRGFEPCH